MKLPQKHNKPSTPTDTQPKIVVGDGKRHRKPLKLRLKAWGIGLVCVVVAIGIAWGTYALTKGLFKPGKPQTVASTQQKKKVDVASLTPEERYHYQTDQGDYTGAEQTLAAQLTSATSTEGKVEIYAQQANVALQFKHYSDAENYANQALKLDSSSNIPYATLSAVAQAQGDKTKATAYMQQAIAHLDKSLPQYGLILNDYQKRLQEIAQ